LFVLMCFIHQVRWERKEPLQARELETQGTAGFSKIRPSHIGDWSRSDDQIIAGRSGSHKRGIVDNVHDIDLELRHGRNALLVLRDD
jgi:hypothetical protein